MTGLGRPDTLRHTVSTELHTLGVTKAQIDTAAGSAGTGTNKPNYRHLHPEYLQELVAGVKTYWKEAGRFTSVHLHPSIARPASREGRTRESGFA